MPVTILTGNIFTTKCQTIVNTINCVGVMGAGIALECRLRYPIMYEKYVGLCNDKKIDIGLLWIYKTPDSDRWILNFPTKKHWKYPSKKDYLHAGLDKFCNTYQERQVKSIAFPLLGADKGGIPPEESIAIMRSYLDKVDVNVEIYKYDPNAKDDLYDKIKKKMLSINVDQISKATNLRKNYVVNVIEALQRPDIVQLNQLARVKGIGIKTLAKIFIYADTGECSVTEPTLFDFK
nr:macro domain-containing protein [uncultured Desulfobacter sp.]